MLKVDGLRIACQLTGTIFDEATVAVEPGITLVTGLVGSGSSTLLNVIAGRRQLHVSVCGGSISIDGKPTGNRNAQELTGAVRQATWRPNIAGALRPIYRSQLGQTAIDELDLGRYLDYPISQLPQGIAARAALAVCFAQRASVYLLDQILAPMTPPWRERAAAFVQRRAQQGDAVLWAEHALEAALPVADYVAEISDQHICTHAAGDWESEILPRTPLRELAWRATLDPALCPDPETAARALAEAGLSVLVGQLRLRQAELELRAEIPAQRLGLSGPVVRVCGGEVIGVVSAKLSAATQTARRLVGAVRGKSVGDRNIDRLLDSRSVRACCSEIDRKAGLGGDAALSRVRELLGPLGSRRGSEHSDGQRQVMAAALALALGEVSLLVEPTLGVDGYTVGELGYMLSDPRTRTVILTSRDIEFVVRHCDRILVVDAQQVLADGSPTAVLEYLPWQPQLSRVSPGRRVVRNSGMSLVPSVAKVCR